MRVTTTIFYRSHLSLIWPFTRFTGHRAKVRCVLVCFMCEHVYVCIQQHVVELLWTCFYGVRSRKRAIIQLAPERADKSSRMLRVLIPYVSNNSCAKLLVDNSIYVPFGVIQCFVGNLRCLSIHRIVYFTHARYGEFYSAYTLMVYI